MSILKSAATVGAATMVSRVLGFVRDILIAAMLGAGPVADAFFVAFKLPNLFRRLFAEGAFNSAFVPLFSRKLESAGERQARIFAEQTLSVLLCMLLGLTIAAEIAMPWLMRVVAPGFTDSPDKFADVVLFARIMFPYLLFISLVALYGGVLNSLYRFAAAAFSPVLLNIILIAALMIAVPFTGWPGKTLSWAVAFAGVAQFLALAIAAHRAGIRLRIPVPRLTPDVRRLLTLALPGAVAGGIGQLNLFVGNMIASLEDSAVSYLYYADRLYQLPLGVIGVAIGIVLLPDLSRRLRVGDHDGAMNSQNRAIEFALLLTLPATAGLLTIPGPIVSVLFARGAFGAADAQATAFAVGAFALGLPAYVLIKLFSPAYFAREDMVTPLKYAAAGVAVNIGLSVSLFFVIGFVGIALATSAAAWVNAILLGIRLAREKHLGLDGRARERLPRIVFSAGVLAALLWGGAEALRNLLTGPSDMAGIGALAMLVVGGLAAFALLAQLTGAATLREVKSAFRRSG